MTSEREIHIQITFRHTEPTDPLREYATEKVTHCIRKFVHHDTEVHLVLSVQKNRHIADVSFHTDGADFACTEECDNLYASIDKLVATLGNQLRKHKEKLKKHH